MDVISAQMESIDTTVLLTRSMFLLGIATDTSLAIVSTCRFWAAGCIAVKPEGPEQGTDTVSVCHSMYNS